MYYNQARVSARMQELRKKSNYTQEKMAELMNVSLDHYRAVETGRRSCSIDFLVDVAVKLDVSLDYLVLGKTLYPDTEYVKSEIRDIIVKLSGLQTLL